LIAEKQSVENLEVLGEIRNVVSVSSTALITAKLSFGNELDCFHLLNVVKSRLIEVDLELKIRTIFERLNINDVL